MRSEGFLDLFLTLLLEIRCRNDDIPLNGMKSQGAERVEIPGSSGTVEARINGSSEMDDTDAGRDDGDMGPGRDSNENGGESGVEAFFDALERQGC